MVSSSLNLFHLYKQDNTCLFCLLKSAQFFLLVYFPFAIICNTEGFNSTKISKENTEIQEIGSKKRTKGKGSNLKCSKSSCCSNQLYVTAEPYYHGIFFTQQPTILLSIRMFQYLYGCILFKQRKLKLPRKHPEKYFFVPNTIYCTSKEKKNIWTNILMYSLFLLLSL